VNGRRGRSLGGAMRLRLAIAVSVAAASSAGCAPSSHKDALCSEIDQQLGVAITARNSASPRPMDSFEAALRATDQSPTATVDTPYMRASRVAAHIVIDNSRCFTATEVAHAQADLESATP
jgi:hypothetical protein